MPTIAVHRLCDIDDASLRVLQEIQMLRDRIRRRAYDFYEARDAADGDSVDDWLRAEREICWVPQEDLQETDRTVHVIIGVSGLADEKIEVTLLPEMLLLRGASEDESDRQRGADSLGSESIVLFRQIFFPSPVHTESAVVRLEEGQLRVSAAKAEPA